MKKFVRQFFFFCQLVAFWGACALTNTAHAQSQVINPGGGVAPDYSDGMELSLGFLGDLQMVVNGIGHLYHTSSRAPNMGLSSVTLRLDGPTGNGRIYNRYNMQPVSQSAITGSGTVGSPWQVVTVFRPNVAGDTGIAITLTDSYVYPTYRMTRRIDVTGLSAADTARLYWYFDTQTGGSDAGIGYVTPGSIIGTRHPSTLEKLQFEYNAAFPLWDHFHTGYYYEPTNMIAGGTGNLLDTVIATSVDAGLGLQWNIPAGSTSFTAGSDLVYIPAGVFARESFTPASIRINAQSRMQVTLTSVNPAQATVNFQYALPLGMTVAATPNLVNTCTPGGGTVTASGSAMTVNNLVLDAKPVSEASYSCTIEFNVVGTQVGQLTPNFSSPDASVGHSAITNGFLEVTPTVVADAVFNPASILQGGTTDLRITVSNRDATTAQTGQNISFDTYDSSLVPVSPVQMTSTCASPPVVTVTGTSVDLSQIGLNIAPSETTPSSCVITLRMSAANSGGYGAYFASSTGVGVNTNPNLQVQARVVVSARFTPPQVLTGAKSRFEIFVANSTASAVSNLNFTYNFYSGGGVIASSPLNLTNTCTGGSVATSGEVVTVSGIGLAGNANQPVICTISFDVDAVQGGYYSASMSSPDGSVGNFGSAEIYVTDTPLSGAGFSTQLNNSSVAIDQISQFVITLSTAENVSVTGLGFETDLPPGVDFVPGSVQSTCPGGASLTIRRGQFVATNVSLPAAPTGGVYECTIRLNLSSSTPGTYPIYTFSTAGPWGWSVATQQYLTVSPAFTPVPPPAAARAIPSSSAWSLMAMFLGLLWLTSRRRQFSNKVG